MVAKAPRTWSFRGSSVQAGRLQVCGDAPKTFELRKKHLK